MHPSPVFSTVAPFGRRNFVIIAETAAQHRGYKNHPLKLHFTPDTLSSSLRFRTEISMLDTHITAMKPFMPNLGTIVAISMILSAESIQLCISTCL